MGEEKSKLLQVAHITVLGAYTLHPIPYIWSAASVDLLSCYWAALCWVPWAVRLVLSILIALWDLMPLKHEESWDASLEAQR